MNYSATKNVYKNTTMYNTAEIIKLQTLRNPDISVVEKITLEPINTVAMMYPNK